jgi:hypothetical protein
MPLPIHVEELTQAPADPLPGAKADALATIDEIDRQVKTWPADGAPDAAACGLIANVATKGRESLPVDGSAPVDGTRSGRPGLFYTRCALGAQPMRPTSTGL